MKETSEIPLKHGKLLTAIMTIVTLVYVSPIFIVLMNSFKANTFVKTDTFAWPTGEALVGWANYIKGFTFGNYPFFINSVDFDLYINGSMVHSKS